MQLNSLVLLIIYLKIIFKKLLNLINKFTAQILIIYKLTKDIIIDKDKYFYFKAYQIIFPYFENFNKS